MSYILLIDFYFIYDFLFAFFSLQGIADAGIALTILTAFCFIPAGYTIYLVKERVNGEKQLQHLCGVGIVLYWLNAIFWDLVGTLASLWCGYCALPA